MKRPGFSCTQVRHTVRHCPRDEEQDESSFQSNLANAQLIAPVSLQGKALIQRVGHGGTLNLILDGLVSRQVAPLGAHLQMAPPAI